LVAGQRNVKNVEAKSGLGLHLEQTFDVAELELHDRTGVATLHFVAKKSNYAVTTLSTLASF
jgi:hypothetical protein